MLWWFWTQGSGEIVFESLRCLGSESSLFHCPRANSTCSHSNDVGLSCQGSCFSMNGISLIAKTLSCQTSSLKDCCVTDRVCTIKVIPNV